MECKDRTTCAENNIARVLIETLWNVKKPVCMMLVLIPLVLIETLWNVKKINSIYYFEPGGRINRNIVECKAREKAMKVLDMVY